MSFCDEHGTADYCGECVYGPEIERLTAERDAARAEARELREENEAGAKMLAQYIDQTDETMRLVWELRAELARVREIVSGMREYADSCDHPSEASKRNAVEYWLAQLEDALSQPEQPAESLPLMAPATAARVLNDEAQRPLGRRYRVTDTDEHGLPVIPREPGMPEGARYRGWTESTQRWSYYTRYIKRHAHDRFERIEDYRESGQEGRG